MSRWLWWAPFGLLTLWLAVHFFRLGWIAAHLTETEIIDRYAKIYLQDRLNAGFGNRASEADCQARPGAQKSVWLVVECKPDGEVSYEYHIDSLGRLLRNRDRRFRPVPVPGKPEA